MYYPERLLNKSLSAESGQGRKLVYSSFTHLFTSQSLQCVLGKYEASGNWKIGKSTGRPSTANAAKNRREADQLMTDRRNTTIRIITSKLNISQSSVVRIISSIPDFHPPSKSTQENKGTVLSSATKHNCWKTIQKIETSLYQNNLQRKVYSQLSTLDNADKLIARIALIQQMCTRSWHTAKSG